MFKMTTELAGLLGIDVKRLRLDWVSSAEGMRFAEIAREFTEQIKTLGPSQLKQAA